MPLAVFREEAGPPSGSASPSPHKTKEIGEGAYGTCKEVWDSHLKD